MVSFPCFHPRWSRSPRFSLHRCRFPSSLADVVRPKRSFDAPRSFHLLLRPCLEIETSSLLLAHCQMLPATNHSTHPGAAALLPSSAWPPPSPFPAMHQSSRVRT